MPQLVGELASLLEHADQEVRLAAAWACLGIGRKAAQPEVVARLARLLNDEGADALREAVESRPEAAALRRKLAASVRRTVRPDKPTPLTGRPVGSAERFGRLRSHQGWIAMAGPCRILLEPIRKRGTGLLIVPRG